MLNKYRMIIYILSCLVLFSCSDMDSTSNLKDEFQNPTDKYRPYYGGSVNQVLNQMDQIVESGYAGPCLGVRGGDIFSDDWFASYCAALDTIKTYGKTAIMYDDVGFPSGTGMNRIHLEYPQHIARKIRLTEKDVTGPITLDRIEMYYEGDLLGTAAWNTETNKRINISDHLANGQLTWDVPEGLWKIMTFYMIQDGRLIDYMNPEAVDKYIELNYEGFYEGVGDYMGDVLVKNFWDDVGFLYFTNPWTIEIGNIFRERYDKDPVLYYPALFYEIGDETEAARSALFGIRAELLGENWVKRITDWLVAHNMDSYGHPPGAYEPNPNVMMGDPFKYYKYETRPLMDQVWGYPSGRPGWKVSSSAGIVNNKPVFSIEIDSPIGKACSRIAMEAQTRGFSEIIPYAGGNFGERLEGEYAQYHEGEDVDPVMDWTTYIARSNSLLQGGRTVADIALIYPIESLQAWDYFEEGIVNMDDPSTFPVEEEETSGEEGFNFASVQKIGGGSAQTTRGIRVHKDSKLMSGVSKSIKTVFGQLIGVEEGKIPAERAAGSGQYVHPNNDYNKISELLSNQIRHDFTFIEADELNQDKFTIEDGILKLNQPDTWQEYKLVIVPSSQINSVEMMKKLKRFYESGGRILFTGDIANRASEFGRDAELVSINKELLGVEGQPTSEIKRQNDAGGKIAYIPKATNEALAAGVEELLPDADVKITSVPELVRADMGDVILGVDMENGHLPEELFGELSYIHNVKDGKDIYMFINTTDNPVSTTVKVAGKKKLEKWNPHSGSISEWETDYKKESGMIYTTFELNLPPISGIFAVGK